MNGTFFMWAIGIVATAIAGTFGYAMTVNEKVNDIKVTSSVQEQKIDGVKSQIENVDAKINVLLERQGIDSRAVVKKPNP